MAMSLEEGKRDKTTTSRHRNPPGSEHGARLGDYVAASGRVQPVARLPRHDDSEPLVRALNVGVGACSFCLNLLIRHPFVVMRRQCQINNCPYYPAGKLSAPMSTAMVMWRMQHQQGARCLWKGLSSTYMTMWLEAAFQGVIVATTPCPRSAGDIRRVKQFFQYLAMRGACTVFALPFYSASLLETVQSQVTSEGEPSVWDFVQQALFRIVGRTPHFSRRNLLPLWSSIAAPALLRSLLRELLGSVARPAVLWLYSFLSSKSAAARPATATTDNPQQQDASNPAALGAAAGVTTTTVAAAAASPFDSNDDVLTSVHHLATDIGADAVIRRLSLKELIASTISRLIGEVLLYPLETVLQRMHVQGTRLIVDNIETGLGIMPHDSAYDGFWDCVHTIRRDEGVGGFYKGFSALMLQVCAEVLLLHVTRITFSQVNSGVFSSPSLPSASQQQRSQHQL
eukprot:scpid58290/ scgid15986/ Solute carrier family 25 member 46